MGWFIGITGRNQSLKKQVQSLYSEAMFEAEEESFFLAGGGLDSTLHFQRNEETKAGWVASGIGISNADDPQLLDQRLWQASVHKGSQHLHKINGHFAVATWNDQQVELITDQLGIRNIFIHEGNDFVLFSTRIDWIMKLIPASSFNWKNFGSRWLAINQFSSNSFMEGIERLSQGGHAVITPQKVEVSNRRWNYDSVETSPEKVKELLLNLTSLALNEEQKLSVGLSGGIDSRTIFATLLKKPEANWGLHTFGEKEHPDAQMAVALNKHYGRKHYLFYQKEPSAHELEKLMPGYIGQTLLTSTPPNLISLQAYQKINELNLMVVDGGLGEIARRRYLISLLLKAKKALLENNIDKILPHLRLHRADIFTEECHSLMMAGMKEELAAEIEALPSIEEIGLENWLDLFSIRTRIPNAGGPEQSRSDSEIFSYMPFVQPQFVQQVLNLPLKHRKNARLFRSIIKENAPKLQKEALVKGDFIYPYWMKDISASVWMRLKQKLGKQYKSTLPVDFLFLMEEYVRDLYKSQSHREFSGYDQQKIDQLITGFYEDKNTALAGELNWWLAFEVFRGL